MQLKYIKQRYVDPYASDNPQQQSNNNYSQSLSQPKTKNQNHNLNVSANYDKKLKVSPQSNTFQAIQELKRSDEHLDGLKRRLSYLKIHQDRNLQKVLTNQKKINLHYDAQQAAKRDKINQLKYFQALRRGIQQQRSMNQQDKIKRQSRRKQVKQSLHNSHVKDVFTTKKKSQQFAMSIKKMKQGDLHQKQSRRDSIVEMQQSNRSSIKLKISRKLEDIHMNRALDATRFKQKNIQRQLQMMQLSRLQANMIQRHSKSRMVYQESEKRLRSVRKQTQKTNRSEKSTERTQRILPQIALRNGKNNTNIIII